MKRFAVGMLTLAITGSISCSCFSAGVSAAGASDIVTETEGAAHNENSGDDTLAELKAAEKTEVVAIGLSRQQLSEAFALAAYGIDENYLKPNGLASDSITWDQTAEQWDVLSYYLKELIFYAGLEPATCDELLSEMGDAFAPSNLILRSVSENIFRYCYAIQNYDLNNLDIFRDEWKEMTMENITFSDEQMQLGEKVAREISEMAENEKTAETE